MPYGYSFFDFFWKRKEKIRILKLMSKRERMVYIFLHGMTRICFLTIIFFSFISYFFLKESIWSLGILVLVIGFCTFSTQSIFRKFILIKYNFYKTEISKFFSIFGSIINFIGFISLITYVSKIVPISFTQTLIYFITDYFGLISIRSLSFPYEIREINYNNS